MDPLTLHSRELKTLSLIQIQTTRDAKTQLEKGREIGLTHDKADMMEWEQTKNGLTVKAHYTTENNQPVIYTFQVGHHTPK